MGDHATESVDLFGVPSSKVHSYKQVPIADPRVTEFWTLPLREQRRMQRIEYDHECAPVPPTPMEALWRHQEWWRDRERVDAALVACGTPQARLERFRWCGGDAWVMVDRDSGDCKLWSRNCGDRFCAPCMRARAAHVRRRLNEYDRGSRKQFITFTLEHKPQSMVTMLDHLFESFAKVRRARVFSDNVTAGVGAIEAKRGSGSGEWHVHLHSICVTEGLHWGQLYEAWRKATGGRNNLKAEIPRDADQVGHYCSKYVGKGFDPSVLRDHGDLCECVLGLKGRRMLIPFGGWYGRKDADQNRDERRWSPVAPLREILERADAGESVAIGALTAISRRKDALHKPYRDLPGRARPQPAYLAVGSETGVRPHGSTDA